MPTAPASASAAADAREAASPTQRAQPLEKGSEPLHRPCPSNPQGRRAEAARISGQLASGELPAAVMAATTVGALLSGISGSTKVPFDRHLQDLCDKLAAKFGSSGGPRLTCVAADEALPIGAVSMLTLIADLLVTDAFVRAFPPGRGGRIAVSFTARQEAWQLTVDDSGITRSHGDPCDDGMRIARQLVLGLGGRLETPRVTGGTRCVVTLPRLENAAATSTGGVWKRGPCYAAALVDSMC